MDIYKRLSVSIGNKEDVTLITITEVSDETTASSRNEVYADLVGSKALVWKGGQFHTEKDWPEKLQSSVVQDAIKALKEKKSKTFSIKMDDRKIEYFVEVYPAPPHLVIAGAGHVARPVAQLGKMVGFDVTVVCDRPDFANEDYFPWADEVICTPYIDYFRHFEPGDNTYLLLVTRGHRFDVLILNELLQNSIQGYIGMIGSRRRISGVFSQLQKVYPNKKFDHIHSPVGLDIGAETPEEIAVSIIAEILQVKNKKSGKPLREVIKYFIKEDK